MNHLLKVTGLFLCKIIFLNLFSQLTTLSDYINCNPFRPRSYFSSIEQDWVDIRFEDFFLLSSLFFFLCPPQGTDRSWQPLAIASQTRASQQLPMCHQQHNPPLPPKQQPMLLAEGRTTMFRAFIHIDVDCCCCPWVLLKMNN